jgi:hypothetical protein
LLLPSEGVSSESSPYQSSGINRNDFGLTWNAALETGSILVGEDVRIALEARWVHAQGDQETDFPSKSPYRNLGARLFGGRRF